MADIQTESVNIFPDSTKMATQADLRNLMTQVVKILKGTKQLGKDGYIPFVTDANGNLSLSGTFPELMNIIPSGGYGLRVLSNGQQVAENVKTVDISGQYVSFGFDQNQNLTISIDKPEYTASRFNCSDRDTDAHVIIENKRVLTGVPVPQGNNFGVQGWLDGCLVKCMNGSGTQSDPLKIRTIQQAYASNRSSSFNIMVFGSNGTKVAEYSSNSIDAGQLDQADITLSGLNGSQASMRIMNFQASANAIMFIPEFTIDLEKLSRIRDIRRFRIVITHIDGSSQSTYDSGYFFYNNGKLPSVQDAGDSMLFTALTSVIFNCSGLKYYVSGDFTFSISGVQDLSNKCPITEGSKVSFFNSSADSWTAMTENQDGSWSCSIPVNTMNFNGNILTGHVSLKNLMGQSTVPVSGNFLVCSQENSATTALEQHFDNQTYRVKNDFRTSFSGNQIRDWDPTQALNSTNALMVVPGVGLSYPYGNWQTFNPTPTAQPNYDTLSNGNQMRLYTRKFSGNQKVKLGGMFTIMGVSRQQLQASSPAISLIMSCDNGTTWYDLKSVRNTVNTIPSLDSTKQFTGIMTGIQQIQGGVQVKWAYPGNLRTSAAILLQVGMQPNAPVIKSIALSRTDGSKDW